MVVNYTPIYVVLTNNVFVPNLVNLHFLTVEIQNENVLFLAHGLNMLLTPTDGEMQNLGRQKNTFKFQSKRYVQKTRNLKAKI